MNFCLHAALLLFPRGLLDILALSSEYRARVLWRGLRCPIMLPAHTPNPKTWLLVACLFPFDLLGTIKHRKSRVIY